MVMMNLDTPLDRKTKPEPKAPPSERRAFLAVAPEQWSWTDLRDFVVAEIQSRQGPQPRNPKTESAIFKRFKETWGDHAGPIACHAFSVYDGWWAGAPISVNRFCKGSDPFFAAKIEKAIAT